MYIHKLACSWVRHPFWRGSFLLTEPQDLSAIRECGVGEVWVGHWAKTKRPDPESPESPESPEPRAQSPEPRAQSPEPRAQSPENCRRSNLCRLVH
ncbi:DUF3391 domain-containing protein [Pseudomonas syringae]|nr:DUF3391 domain-containing protein [Pseudomonas syringae]